MRKITKRLVSFLLAAVMIFTLSFSAFAAASDSLYVNESDIEIVPDNALTGTPDTSEPAPNFVNDYRYRKVNVTTSHEWSPYKRVSDNIQTGSEGGSISASKSVTFGTDVSGEIAGLDISTNASISSEVGYTLNVGANKRVYMGYRVYYEVEKGTREYYDIVTGEVIKSNPYTVKVPQYGEYKLINY